MTTRHTLGKEGLAMTENDKHYEETCRKRLLDIAEDYTDDLQSNSQTGFAEAYAKCYAAASLEELGKAVDAAIYGRAQAGVSRWPAKRFLACVPMIQGGKMLRRVGDNAPPEMFEVIVAESYSRWRGRTLLRSCNCGGDRRAL
jgi:hypothetical protein